MTSASVLTLALFGVVFLLVQQGRVDRQQAMLGGAGAFLVLGWLMGFYPIREAIGSIYFDTLALIFGMSLIADLLSRSGFFRYLAFRTAWFSRGNPVLTMVLFVLVTYTVSLVVNNLGAMLILLPLTVACCQLLEIDAAPIVAAELIASNLGGASTLVGDFPNMIIGAAANLHFGDFIGGMMVPCLLLLAVLLLFFRRQMAFISGSVGRDQQAVALFFQQQAGKMVIVDPRRLRIGMTILILTLVGFLLAEVIGVRPATVAFVAGLVVLGLGHIPARELFKAISGGDILFFFGLFVMVGGLQAAGVLEQLHQLMLVLGGGYATLSLLVLMWTAGVVTPFLNAGPATAFLIPVAEAMSRDFSSSNVWWALSLGVLAGSSATLSGATAGPIVASQSTLDFQRYLQWGVPMAVGFLSLSTVYIVLIGA
ncbi:MAG: sodium:proton antiporter [Magnetococcales bacterium]|nr:sodium:proton antiporter [Magnetococcales bacterium]